MPNAIMDTWNDRPTWQEVCYIIVSILIILNGIYVLLQGFDVIPSLAAQVGNGTYFKIIGTLWCVFGIGLLTQQIWAQYLVKWCSVLSLVVSLWSILLAWGMVSIAGYLPMVIAAAYAGFYGFTIYIIHVVGDVDP